jgi:GNAT superfamily N-acetyltransferase
VKVVRPMMTKRQPSTRIRAIDFEDVAEVLRLVRRAVDHGCRDHYDSTQRNAVYASYARNLFVEALGSFDTVVLEQHGRLIAVAQLDPADSRLRALFVDAGYQHQGVGRALLADVEERARARGASRLHGAMSLNAVSFYLQAGFRPCTGPERLASARVSIPVQRMEKDLGAPRPGGLHDVR